jgi:hypothetical protein
VGGLDAQVMAIHAIVKLFWAAYCVSMVHTPISRRLLVSDYGSWPLNRGFNSLKSTLDLSWFQFNHRQCSVLIDWPLLSQKIILIADIDIRFIHKLLNYWQYLTMAAFFRHSKRRLQFLNKFALKFSLCYLYL